METGTSTLGLWEGGREGGKEGKEGGKEGKEGGKEGKEGGKEVGDHE